MCCCTHTDQRCSSLGLGLVTKMMEDTISCLFKAFVHADNLPVKEIISQYVSRSPVTSKGHKSGEELVKSLVECSGINGRTKQGMRYVRLPGAEFPVLLSPLAMLICFLRLYIYDASSLSRVNHHVHLKGQPIRRIPSDHLRSLLQCKVNSEGEGHHDSEGDGKSQGVNVGDVEGTGKGSCKGRLDGTDKGDGDGKGKGGEIGSFFPKATGEMFSNCVGELGIFPTDFWGWSESIHWNKVGELIHMNYLAPLFSLVAVVALSLSNGDGEHAIAYECPRFCLCVSYHIAQDILKVYNTYGLQVPIHHLQLFEGTGPSGPIGPSGLSDPPPNPGNAVPQFVPTLFIFEQIRALLSRSILKAETTKGFRSVHSPTRLSASYYEKTVCFEHFRPLFSFNIERLSFEDPLVHDLIGAHPKDRRLFTLFEISTILLHGIKDPKADGDSVVASASSVPLLFWNRLGSCLSQDKPIVFPPVGSSKKKNKCSILAAANGNAEHQSTSTPPISGPGSSDPSNSRTKAVHRRIKLPMQQKDSPHLQSPPSNEAISPGFAANGSDHRSETVTIPGGSGTVMLANSSDPLDASADAMNPRSDNPAILAKGSVDTNVSHRSSPPSGMKVTSVIGTTEFVEESMHHKQQEQPTPMVSTAPSVVIADDKAPQCPVTAFGSAPGVAADSSSGSTANADESQEHTPEPPEAPMGSRTPSLLIADGEGSQGKIPGIL